MKQNFIYTLSTVILSFCMSCSSSQQQKKAENAGKQDTVHTAQGTIDLPAPYDTKSVNNSSHTIGWTQGKMPVAPQGFTVNKFAEGLQSPRWIYIASNGDIFIAESSTGRSANRISLLRDTNGDGVADFNQVFLTGLNRPFGMLIMGNNFYVGNTDGLVQYPYSPGQTSITASGKKILDLPAGGYNNHWTRNLLASKDGKKIFVTVGSGTNVGEHGMDNEIRRADILEINPDGTGERVYASGLRNPIGLAYAPGTNTLWTAVNERDELGDELVPDYITSVKDGGFYGWPYSYWGQHVDPRVKEQRADLVQKAIVPDVSMGAHTAALGLAFDEKNSFGGKYSGGAFVGQHGSWNRATLSGYAVVFVPFKNGKASGPKEDFLSGFIADSSSSKVYGRPVGVAFDKHGALLVADDTGNIIWCVRKK